jgi:hypothetical protein
MAEKEAHQVLLALLRCGFQSIDDCLMGGNQNVSSIYEVCSGTKYNGQIKQKW